MKTIKRIKVQNFVSPRSGNEVPNQFQILTPEGTYFQSYSSMIAFIDKKGNLFLDEDKWNYSKTTSKYRNEFTRMDTKETKDAIKSGEIKLVDLS